MNHVLRFAGAIVSRGTRAGALLFAMGVPGLCAAQAPGAGSATTGAAGSSASGQASGSAAGSAQPGSRGGNAAGQNGAGGSAANARATADVAAGPQSYAAAASPGVDPRKPVAAAAGALTLEQVLDRARAANPSLLAAAANLRSVRAQEIQAAVRSNPYLGGAGTFVTEPSDASSPATYSVQMSRLFERGNKRSHRIENARATTAQTAAQLEDTIRQTLLQVKTAFTHTLFAKQALALSQAQLADFRHEVDIAHERFVAGDLGKLDYERLDLQLGAFESDAANNEIAYRQASAQLQALMGVANPSASFDVSGEIVPPATAFTREQLLTKAIAARPDIAAAQAGVRVAESAYRLAIANGTTDPTVEGELDHSGSENSFGFNVNIPLRIFDRNQGNKEVARLAIDTARLNETAARVQVVSDVEQAWVAYEKARDISDRYGSHYLDESADVLSIARFAFDHGGLALIDYLDALREARTSTSNALNAYQQTWLALHQLSASAATAVLP